MLLPVRSCFIRLLRTPLLGRGQVAAPTACPSILPEDALRSSHMPSSRTALLCTMRTGLPSTCCFLLGMVWAAIPSAKCPHSALQSRASEIEAPCSARPSGLPKAHALVRHCRRKKSCVSTTRAWPAPSSMSCWICSMAGGRSSARLSLRRCITAATVIQCAPGLP